MKKDLIKIYNHFGAENQLNKLEEELNELLEVIKDIRKDGWTWDNIDCFYNEAADVEVMIDQHKAVKGINARTLFQKKFKIDRTLDRIKSKFYDKIK